MFLKYFIPLFFFINSAYAYDDNFLKRACEKEISLQSLLCNEVGAGSVRYHGNQVLSNGLIDSVVKGCSASSPIAAYAIKTRINSFYACMGYINSGAVLEGDSGNYSYRIIEGTLEFDHIKVEGGSNSDASKIKKYLLDGQDSLVLNIHTLRARLDQLKKKGVYKTLNTTVYPLPGKVGKAGLRITLKSNTLVSWNVSIDNYQTEATGKEGFNLLGSRKNIFQLFDVGGANVSLSEGAQGLSLFYKSYYSGDGSWSINVDQKFSKIVSSPLDDLDITGESSTISFGQHNLLWKRLTSKGKVNDSETLELSSSLEVTKSQNQLLGRNFSFAAGEEDGSTLVSSIKADLLWQKKQRSDTNNYALSASLGIDKGISAFGSTDSTEDSAGSDYEIIKVGLGYKRSFSEFGSLFFSLNSQYSDDYLPATKKIGLGGVGNVRGVKKGLVSVDSSLLLSSELVTRLNRFNLYSSQDHLRDGNIYGRVFIDYGFGDSNLVDRSFQIGSAGLGVTWNLNKKSKIDLFWAKPFDSQGFSKEEEGVFDGGEFGLSVSFSGGE